MSKKVGSDREFMERALEAARKSRTEDGRVHPLVGVVVAKDGHLLALAHRGEKKAGEHAEYTALERTLKNRALYGATVYTTLEPCTTRGHPKVPCAQRLIERKVTRVVVGMIDPNQASSLFVGLLNQ
jgi:pyrimidine deaminase RibD-like protein